jgi:hypothetical protein
MMEKELIEPTIQFLKRTIGNSMSSSDRVSLPIRTSPGDAPDIEPKPPAKKPLSRVINRHATSAAFIVMLTIAGWSTYRYFESTKAEIDQDLISDLETFDSAPSLSNVPKPNDMASVEQKMIDLPPALPGQSATEPTDDSTVWLTGTIEETEPANDANPSIRISGGPAETSSIR